MLIFDGFKGDQATKFADKVKDQFGHQATVCESQDDSDRIDPFPFVLIPPIVLVERKADYANEGEIRRLVQDFGGSYAGT